MLNALPDLAPDLVSEQATPRVIDFINRMRAAPGGTRSAGDEQDRQAAASFRAGHRAFALGLNEGKRSMQYRRIATEEAWAIPEQFDAWRELLKKSTDYDPDLFLARAQTDGGLLSRRLLDVDEERLRIMDEARRRCAPARAHFDGRAGPRNGTRRFDRSARQRSACRS